MPIKIPDNLPAARILAGENIFVMPESRAFHQDIRPLRILLLNLMPTKIITETQILRLLGNTPLQVEVEFLHPGTYTSRNTPRDHLIAFYKTFDEIRYAKFDGMIITGAPVEHLEFSEVAYWEELKKIMDWSVKNVFAVLYLCWGAQAGLYHHFGVPKYRLEKKIFGVFPHTVNQKDHKLLKGFDDIFYAPHSRHTENRREDIVKVSGLEILAESAQAGIYLTASLDGRHVFVTGHSEYEPLTLKAEYERDLGKGLEIDLPSNYFPGDDPANRPVVNWRGHANLLFTNWLNYFVYQETPFNLNEIG